MNARFFEPMLCLAVPKLPEGPEWELELKLDGYRGMGIGRAVAGLTPGRATRKISTKDSRPLRAPSNVFPTKRLSTERSWL